MYPIDPGLIPVFDRSGRANAGHILETCILLELDRRRAEVAYVRTLLGNEVDFLARYPGGEQELIQVCASLGEATVREREIRYLLDAADEHPKAKLLMISQSGESLRNMPNKIAVHSAVSWLLSDGTI